LIDIIIGQGEVGKALGEVLGERRKIKFVDPPQGLHWTEAQMIVDGGCDWMHVAFPHSDPFKDDVCAYWLDFRPKHIVIHSTVPVGTTRAISKRFAVPVGITYSPIRGIHPHLARYIREFPKWLATNEDAETVCDYFQASGMQTRIAPSFETLEWMKLIETTEYYARIALWQEIERQYVALDLPDGALTALKSFLFEKRKVYDGDRGLAPIMNGGVIRGHCLCPNLELLRKSVKTSPQFYRWLKESNEMRKGELG